MRFFRISVKCPIRVKRVGFVMSAVCPVYPQQQTSPDTVGTSHLCQTQTWARLLHPPNWDWIGITRYRNDAPGHGCVSFVIASETIKRACSILKSRAAQFRCS